ncbi:MULTISPECIES: MATE family efflux transporter [Methanohalophilus]|uniref:Multidrug export protein MepA n=1 Tax=Methanohalophilus euhalobius TaxID=51203 RepID=A0A285FXK0_9EURY|nr:MULTISPECIES: MATE family efflux transporter [Methanohalophilus]KXS42274.1 MAG: MATE efflux family protein [Methanohalophilus sp. T328-1]RSD33659.1 MAG: MATE efflux family protein [Methanohalophilus sp.]OBZ34582.1 MAG: MATE family efflux transporter [Methanohalophilus sp. DAL1]ODV50291.1 MAG: MATE efflux family protein [Methanohalophilus sp. 2-GBenrich]PQV42816.1 putative MATE family efflux protein [Methanohalophilus euhalobius]
MKAQSIALGSENIGKLLFRLSAPAAVGMVVMGLYNIVDTIFVGRALGSESVQGIGGIAVSFPVMMIAMAISLAIGLGGSSIISRRLGSDDLEGAEHTFGNIVGLSLSLGFLVLIFGSIFIVPILKAFGATPTILPFARDYLQIILYGTPLITFAQAINNVVRSEGNAKVAMYTMLIGAGFNILLDPILIFGLDMGIKGAAAATVISQSVTTIFLIHYFLSGKSSLQFHAGFMRLDKGIIREMVAIGASPFARNSSTSAIVLVVNNILALYGGDVSIAIYGIFNRMLMFSLMPMIGLLQGMQPIVGFNYGAHNFKRVRETLRISIMSSSVIAVAAFLLLFFLGANLFSIFTTDATLIEEGTGATKIMVLAVPLLGIQFVSGGMYQALGKARPSFILSTARQVFLLPLVLVLPWFFDTTGVWMAFPISDLLAVLLAVYMFMKEYRLLERRSSGF